MVIFSKNKKATMGANPAPLTGQQKTAAGLRVALRSRQAIK
jgi:hypothetical protein